MPSKHWTKTRFNVIRVHEAGRHFRYQEICCSKCPKTETIPDSAGAGLPPEAIGKKFAERGWRLGANNLKDICPECQKMNQIVKVQDTESKLRTEPPRTPTREDRRRIIEALDTHYDTKKERYTQNWSDKSLAEALKVPMAWVAEERDRVYGPNINEAASIRDEKLSDLEKKFSQIEDELLKALDNVRNEIAKLKIDLAYKAG